ncbi:LysE/ArgO family amino acid transporter [Kushneria aurantia]|uniref:LysE/ArgO family amino acid transporter n=1 Tax=Kushneria aurantia TaxID=504092 RepID=A0ABV6FYJ2_9GAMM|nr:LysE/ArgO family amino acid transporter [Kushneria aurantia]
MLEAGLAGFGLGLSLIAAIGAQNAFVLRQGVRGEYVTRVCLACALSDAVLLTLGVMGFAALTARLPALEMVLRYGGALFLLIYGARSLLAALRGGQRLDPAEGTTSARRTLAVCLALTWLNPHVYLDTLVLMGSVSSGFDEGRGAFLCGAILASFLFFFAIGHGAALLRPLLARPIAWRVLDALVGVVMGVIAVSLLRGG